MRALFLKYSYESIGAIINNELWNYSGVLMNQESTR